MPVTALMALLAHVKGVGWNCSAGYFVRPQGWLGCGGFAGRSIFWGPWAQTSYPNGIEILAPILLWFSYGLLVGLPLEWWLHRRAHPRSETEPINR